VPPSSSLSTESTRGGRSRCWFAVSSAVNRGHRRRLRHRPAFSVPVDQASASRVSSRSFPRPPPFSFRAEAPLLDGHRRPPAPGRGGRAGSLTQSTRPTWPVNMDRGPPFSLWGSNSPRCKSSCTFYFNPRNFRIVANIVKSVEYSLLFRKMQMTYQNVHKNEIYSLVLKSCIVKQLWTLSKLEELIVPFITN
jgi:hypothetical protein